MAPARQRDAAAFCRHGKEMPLGQTYLQVIVTGRQTGKLVLPVLSGGDLRDEALRLIGYVDQGNFRVRNGLLARVKQAVPVLVQKDGAGKLRRIGQSRDGGNKRQGQQQDGYQGSFFHRCKAHMFLHF